MTDRIAATVCTPNTETPSTDDQKLRLAARLIAIDCRAGRRTDRATIDFLIGTSPDARKQLADYLKPHVDQRPFLARLFKTRGRPNP